LSPEAPPNGALVGDGHAADVERATAENACVKVLDRAIAPGRVHTRASASGRLGLRSALWSSDRIAPRGLLPGGGRCLTRSATGVAGKEEATMAKISADARRELVRAIGER
jgi:hypothetical protein